MGRGEADSAAALDFGCLRTRSHSRGDPAWTVQDMLILVNEIAAVEGDCQNALSSYQKWGIIAENCTGLGVVRNLNQCRRKWESLVAEYKLVSEWEANSGGGSYWSLGYERRKEAGIPMDFDKELYKAINDFMKTQEQPDSDPENDPDAAEIDVFDAVESGPKSKRIRRRSISHKGIIKERKRLVSQDEDLKPGQIGVQMEQIVAVKLEQNTKLISGPKSKGVRHWSCPQRGFIKERQQPVAEEEHEKLGSGDLAVKLEDNTELSYGPMLNQERHWSVPQNGIIEEREQPVSEEEPEKPSHVEQMELILAENLKKNTELIHAILTGNFSESLEPGLSDLKVEETLETEMVRCKAEKLIACLGDLTKNLEQLCNVVEEG